MRPEKKSVLGILFLTMCLNLTGFAIILPLSPAMMAYYLPHAESSGGLLGAFIASANQLANTLSHGDPPNSASVFFGCLLASLYAFLQFTFAPIWGRLSDRYGRRPVLLVTLAITALAYLIWIFASSFNLLILSRVLGGITAANLSVVSACIADITEKANRTQGMALVGIAFGLGLIFGPVIGGLSSTINIIELYPSLATWKMTPFSFCAGIAFILAAINFLWVYLKFKETLKQCTQEEESHSALAFIQSLKKTNLSYFIFILVFSGLEFTLAFHAHTRLSYGPAQLGYLFLYIGIVLILMQGLIVRRLARLVNERNLAITGILSSVFSYAILAYANTPFAFYVGSYFLAVSVGFTTPSLSSLTSLYATENSQGRHQGKFRSSGSLARALGPIFAASVYFYYGAQVAYLTAPLLLLIPILLIFSLPSPSVAPKGGAEH